MKFHDRRQAGRMLADMLGRYAGREDVVVLGLPRGGVPVASEIAERLQAPLDAFLVRKLGAPGQPELAIGAIASGGVRIVDEPIAATLRVTPRQLAEIEAREQRELERRERSYRGNRRATRLEGKTVILVDDGVATGSSMKAAIRAIRAKAPEAIVVAVPVAPPATAREIGALVDDFVCVMTPGHFAAVGNFYLDFEPTPDEEVTRLLARAEAVRPAGAVRREPIRSRRETPMQNRQVPHAEWLRFFEGFTRRHRGWLATVRVIDPRLGAQIEARDLPLEGIVVDPQARGPISFLLGGEHGANVEHPVDRPEQVWVEVTEEGAEAALEVVSGGGRRTILEFRGAVLPEAVDGLAAPSAGV